MKTLRFLLLAGFICLTVDAGAQTAILDSLIAKLAAHPQDDTIRVDLLNYLNYHSLDQPNKARLYAQQALVLAQKLNYKQGIADAYLGLGEACAGQVDNVKAIHFAILALNAFEQCRVSTGIVGCYNLIGNCYAQGKDYSKASRYFKMAYDTVRKSKDYDSATVAVMINNIGSVWERSGDYDSALVYYQKAVNILEVVDDKSTLADVYTNVGSSYEHLGNYTLAHQYLFKALDLALAADKRHTVSCIYQDIGDVYCKTGDYKQCDRYLNKAAQLARETGNKTRLESLYGSLINLAKSQNNYQAAFHHAERLAQLKDTLYSQARFRQVAEMELQYATEKKEQTIKVLEHDRQDQTLLRNSSLAGALLITIVYISFYVLHRFRARKELSNVQPSLDDKLREIDKVQSTPFFHDRILLPITPTIENSLDDKFLHKVKEVVESNLSDPSFTVEKLADEVHITRKQLLRRLKTLTGLAPSDFIREVRLKKAAGMILQKTDRITQISYAVGFNDQSYFSKSFKKEFGVTPSEYAAKFGQ